MVRCPHCGFEDYEIYYRPDWQERRVAQTEPEAFRDRKFWQCRRCKKPIYVDEKQFGEEVKNNKEGGRKMKDYHIHIYEIARKFEIDVEAEDEKGAKEKAIEIYHTQFEKLKEQGKDCHIIVMAFEK